MDEVLGGGREREPMVCVPSWSLYLSLAVGGFPISSQSQSVCVLKCVLILIKDYTGFAHILNLGMDTCFTQVCRHCTCAQYRGFASVIVKLKTLQFYKIVIVPPVVDLKSKLTVEKLMLMCATVPLVATLGMQCTRVVWHYISDLFVKWKTILDICGKTINNTNLWVLQSYMLNLLRPL